MYPTLIVQPDTKIWKDTKRVSINETLIYTMTPKIDILASANGSYKQNEYVTHDYKFGTERSFDFDSLWIGGIYMAEAIADFFIPQITLQGGILQKERHFDEDKNFVFKSFSAQIAFKNYSDPVISSLYFGSVYNADRNFNYGKLEYGNSFFFWF